MQLPLQGPRVCDVSGYDVSDSGESQPFDTTGQVTPTGMKIHVVAVLWEDEGSLCFQVEVNGVVVSRREDNHFVNGTKLLEVAGLVKSRAETILHSGKVTHTVDDAPDDLEGIWIPFERALELANEYRITERLYPIFVHNIGGLLYNPESRLKLSGHGEWMSSEE